MKKFKFLIFTLLLILPFSVKANAGMPEFRGYDAFVSNPNGAKLYKDENLTDEVGILEYDSKLSVEYECVINGETYAMLEESYKLVLLKDITPKNGDYKITKTDPHAYYLIKDINIYEGPSKTFKVIGTIPKDTEIILENRVDEIWWEYTYNGKKGYISRMETIGWDRFALNLALINEKKSEFLVMSDITEGFTDISNPTDENKINIKISKGTVLTPNYVFYDDYYAENTYHMDYVNVNVNGKSMWIDASNLACSEAYFESLEYVVADEDFIGYSEYGNTTSASKTFKKHHLYKVLWKYYPTNSNGSLFFSIELDGKDYWIESSFDNVNFEFTDKFIEKIEIEDSIPLYDRRMESLEKIGTLNAGSYNAYSLYISWDTYLIEDKGYIKYDDIKSLNQTDKDITRPVTRDKNITNQTDEKFKKLASMEIVLYCIDAAIVLAVIIVVTIILIKKKKNKKLMTTESVENSLITEQTTEVSNDNNLQE